MAAQQCVQAMTPLTGTHSAWPRQCCPSALFPACPDCLQSGNRWKSHFHPSLRPILRSRTDRSSLPGHSATYLPAQMLRLATRSRCSSRLACLTSTVSLTIVPVPDMQWSFRMHSRVQRLPWPELPPTIGPWHPSNKMQITSSVTQHTCSPYHTADASETSSLSLWMHAHAMQACPRTAGAAGEGGMQPIGPILPFPSARCSTMGQATLRA
jgi:hypothetical protein